MTYSGELAALLTAVCWSSNSVFFTLAGHRVGSRAVNIGRLWLAILAMILLHLALAGGPFPFHAGFNRLAWLGVSGLIGFALGDALLFECLVLLGPRLAMLLMTLSPIFAAFMAWMFMGQTLTLPRLAAIGVTLAGIAWVVGEGRGADKADTPGRPRTWALGLLLGVGGALGQAVGLVCSKFGMAGGFSPISANLIRVVAGGAALTVWFALKGDLGLVAGRLRDRRAFAFIAAGAITGPVLGVVASLYAINHTSMGVAATLMSLSPVILLPVSLVVFHERLTLRAVLGTLISIAGAAALFLVHP